MGGIPHPPSQLLLCLPHSLPGRRLAWMSQLCSVFCCIVYIFSESAATGLYFGDAFDDSLEGLSVIFSLLPTFSIIFFCYHLFVNLYFDRLPTCVSALARMAAHAVHLCHP